MIGEFSVGNNYCGDSLIAGSEQCDEDNLNNQTCVTKGYDSGTLTCTEGCMFNESSCSSYQEPTPSGGRGVQQEQVGTSTECSDKIDNDNDKKCDFEGCYINYIWYAPDPGCTNKFDNSEEDASCYSEWKCNEWGFCINSTQERN